MADLLNGIRRVDPTLASAPVLRRAAGRVLSTKLGAVGHRLLFAPMDAALLRVTGGRVSSGFGIVPLVVLRTTGAKSGAPRDVPLGYFTEGDDVILIASNYGQAKHPGWYYNLIRNPECELFSYGRDRGGRFVARLTEDADHDRLYALVEQYVTNYSAYAVRTAGIREIPVFRLSPMAD